MTAIKPISVLVVDDSVVIRRIVSTVLSEDPDIRVVGSAASGRVALEEISRLNPDLMTLDIDMPDMDGLATLRELRRLRSRLPVIMFSTATERAAAATLEALSLGARDYVTKPSDVGSLDAAAEAIRRQLVPRIKALAGPRPGGRPGQRTGDGLVAPPATPVAAARSGAHQILAVGASTGGPDAIAGILRDLPDDVPVPVVVTQHMPPLFTRLFAARLDKNSPLTVVEGTPGMRLEAGLVVIAPGDHHLLVMDDRGTLRVATPQTPPENWCRPAVDVLFRSVASVFGSQVLACVLTGMGQDGLRGCELLHAAGAEIVAQDEPTSIVWGMPGAVTAAGLADRILPLPRIAPDLTAALRRGRKPSSPVSLGRRA